jgi:glycosyltransferase involved in cell wall biosynthesis
LFDRQTTDAVADALDVSVIVPVRNEAGSIAALLDALASQTLQPKEIVIVDGGSVDGTSDLIRACAGKLSFPVVLVEAGPAFPGRARNIAVAQASHQWLAMIDGGTIPDRNWLCELTSAAKTNPDVRIIYGKYLPVTNSYFTHCAAVAYVAPPNTLSPSTASSLLHRSAWEEAGGFREDLRSGEDLLFFKRVSQLKIPQAGTDKAIVHWSLEPSWAGTFRRFATYSRYGMKAGLGGEWQLRVTLLYLILFALLAAAALLWFPLIILPLLFVIFRTERRILRWSPGQRGRWRKVLNPRLVLTVLSINLMIDIAMFCGILQWLRRDVLSNESQMAGIAPKT